jgi:hypothetical protein
MKKIETEKSANLNYAVYRLTAFWAFIESAFGGILHAMRIPFTGLLIGGAAVFFISLIAFFSEKKNDILKSTFAVVLIKGAVSPHTPVTAYFAVMLQGFLGYLFFNGRNHFRTSALLLGITTLLFSSFQKLIILTILFGNTLWNSVNIFLNDIVKQFSSAGFSTDINFSLIIASTYISLHLAAGILIGIISGKLPFWIQSNLNEANLYLIINKQVDELNSFNYERQFRKNKSGLFLLSFLIISIFIASYLIPGKNITEEIIMMIFRGLLIIFIWSKIVSPFLLVIINKFLNKKRNEKAEAITSMVSLFPRLKKTISGSLKISRRYNGWKKLKTFLVFNFIILFLMNIEEK